MKRYSQINILFVVLLLIGFNYVNAQEDISNESKNFPFSDNIDSFIQGESVSCRDFSSQENFVMNLYSDFNNYEVGDVIRIQGSIKNNNTFSIYDADIKARLVKTIKLENEIREVVLDEFSVYSDLNINPKEEIEVLSSYVLPLNYTSGQYSIYVYAVEKDRFDLTDQFSSIDSFSTILPFEITGVEDNYIYIYKPEIIIDDSNVDNYYSGVKNKISNPGLDDRNVKITYYLYSGTNPNPDNKIKTTSETLNLLAGEEVEIEYTLNNKTEPVYFLSTTVEPKSASKDSTVFNEKTIANNFIFADNINKPQINFLAVNNYPIKKGEKNSLITCVENIGPNYSNDVKIESILYDSDNNEISRIEYKGDLYSSIGGLKNDFKTKKDLMDFSIISKIYNSKGEIVDEVVKKYTCDDDIVPCYKNYQGNFTKDIGLLLLYSLLGILIIFLICGLVIRFISKNK